MARCGDSSRTLLYLSRHSHGVGRTLAAAAMFHLVALAAQAQISPGPLSRPHQALSGPTQCTRCHVVGKGSAVLKCQECHTEIAAEMSSGQGLHARFENKLDCARCHSEHNGEDFPLIHWQPSLQGFDHNQTGYRLEGRHAGIECRQCHMPTHIQGAMKSQIKIKNLSKTFLGLSPDCVTCHTDPHQGQLGANCAQCHNFVDWKAATQIDHSKTRFPLTGLHAQVACAKCHAPEIPGGPARLTGMAFAKCADCHRDPHHGAFAQSCETCHTTKGWKIVPEARRFDHSKTKFPLLGKHAQVECAKCHADDDFKKPLAFAKCMDCHTPDPHHGQFAARKDKGECSACHTVDGWKPSLFDVKAHAATAYPLQGRHAAVECAKCHIPAGTETRYKIAFAKCLDCHKDVHGGQFAAAPYHGQCEACHTVNGFQPSTFTIAQHQKSRFALAGAHLAIACPECHTARKGEHAPKIVPYRFADRSCLGCHTNPHRDEFQQQMAQPRADGSAKGCEACHTVKSWTDLPSFNHSKTSFPLLGAHAKVACDDCHKPAGPEGKMTEASFRPTPTHCSACHQDPHAGQFIKAGKSEGCELCHNAEHWKPSTFNHETQSDFSLKGAHEKVECELCHTGHRNINGTRVTFYKPTARDCASCHD